MSHSDPLDLSRSPDFVCWFSDQGSISDNSSSDLLIAKPSLESGNLSVIFNFSSVIIIATSKITCLSPRPVISRSSQIKLLLVSSFM